MKHPPQRPVECSATGQWQDAAIALLLAAGTVLVSRWAAGKVLGHQSTQPHFVLLADALLHGRLWLDPARAKSLSDITPFGGRFYVAFPPMPALLLVPFVAVFGASFNDALFTLLLGAGNVALTYLLVRRLSVPGFAGPGLPLGRGQAIAAAVLLGVGTVHFYTSLMGRVWFTAHIVAVMFLLLYLRECAGRGRPVVAGTALAAAFMARAPTLLGLVFWLVLARRRHPGLGRLLSPAMRFAAPLAIAVALLLAQNMARFGSPLNFGYLTMGVAQQLAADLRRYGQFHSHFLPRNLQALLVTPPIVTPETAPIWLQQVGGPAGALRVLSAPGGSSGLPFPIRFNPWGTGLWAVSPALVFSLRLPCREAAALALAAWLSVVLIAAPDLLYYNTGWYQYGYRFSLDFMPFLLVLTALGLRRPLRGRWRVLFGLLLAASVASNWLGARWFLRLLPY